MAKRKLPKHLPLGTISSGTLRPEDVVPELLWSAEHVHMAKADRAKVRTLRSEWERCTDQNNAACPVHQNEDFTCSEAHDDIWADLLSILENYAPPYCYVGTLEGDGACIGVWMSEDAVAEGIHDGDVWTDPDDGSKIPASAKYRLTVSDHGNMALYHRNGRAIW